MDGMGARRLRLLLVEGAPEICALIGDMLGDETTVQAVPTPQQALPIVIASHPRHFDLAIVDCPPPGRYGHLGPTGIDLIARIHAKRPALPIVAISGAANPEEIIIAAFRSGARDFLRKPFTVEALRTAVARLRPRAAARLDAHARTRHAAVEDVMAFVSEHLGEPVSLDMLAQKTGMSRSHLSRCFRRVAGQPLRSWVQNLRLARAKELLVTSRGASLTQVALDAGFYDLPHFDKVFRQRFGVSPSEFVRRAASVRGEESSCSARK